jgi:hypothetical protein
VLRQRDPAAEMNFLDNFLAVARYPRR